MKTYVIELDKHDDALSIRDKIAWSKSSRVLLVMSERRQIPARVDLILLQRFSAGLGSQLGLVTQNTDLREMAISLGIPVFETVKQAHRVSWRRRRKSFLRPDASHHSLDDLRQEIHSRHLTRAQWWRIPVFVLGIAAFLSLMIFFLPGATIRMEMARRHQGLGMTVWASPDIQTPTLSGGIPAHEVSIILEAHRQVPASGSLSVPDRPAKGKVSLENLTNQDVNIPPDSVILTLTEPPIRFKILELVTVPTGKDNIREVPIEALVPGSQGNVEAGKIQAMEGMVGLQVKVTNPEATSGGGENISPAPTELDYKKLQQQVMESLKQSGAEEINRKLETDQVMLIPGLRVGKILEENLEPAINQPADHLSLSVRAEVHGWYYRQEEVVMVAQKALDASVDKGFAGIPGLLSISSLSKPVMESGRVQWDIYAVREVRATSSQQALISSVIGRSPEEASNNLESIFQLKSLPAISIWPNWWPRLPFLPFRIQVVNL
jgi:hypothetical protein